MSAQLFHYHHYWDDLWFILKSSNLVKSASQRLRSELGDCDVNMAFALSGCFCRSSPHPYITALENRVDCWSALLLEIDDFIQQAADRLAWLQQRPCTLHTITCSFTTCISKPSVKGTPCQITHHTNVSCYYAVLTNTYTLPCKDSTDKAPYKDEAEVSGSHVSNGVGLWTQFDIS